MNRRELMATLIAAVTGAQPLLSDKCDVPPPSKMTSLFRERPEFFGSTTVEVSKLQMEPYGVSCLDSLTLGASVTQKVEQIGVTVHPPSGKDRYFEMRKCKKVKPWYQGTDIYVVPDGLPLSIHKLFMPGTAVSIKAVASSDAPRVFFLKAPCRSTPQKA